MGAKCPGEPLPAPLPVPGAGSPRFVLGCQMGRAGGQRWQRDTELLYSLRREKCHPPRAWGISIPAGLAPSRFPTQLLMRHFAGARQMQTGCPGPGAGSGHAGQRGTFGVSMWRVGVPKAWLVASICFSKSLSGSFTHVSACMCLKAEGKHILCLAGAWSPALGTGSWRHLPGHPTLQEHRAVQKVPTRLSQTLKPPSSASTMSTTLAFQQCQCLNPPCYIPCPAFLTPSFCSGSREGRAGG